MSPERLNLVGAVTAYLIFLSSILVFALRIGGREEVGGWAGVPFLLAVVPLVYLVVTGPSVDRAWLYYLQVSLMILSIALIFVTDYYPGYDFRGRQSLVIPFVMVYFAGLGGMIGVASLAGRGWTIGAVVLFFVTAVLAFVSRWTTGI
ncbi:MAG: hypothetical protein PVF87_00435 [Acidimicrobiia bacterium]|jgi:hypothetical protein